MTNIGLGAVLAVLALLGAGVVEAQSLSIANTPQGRSLVYGKTALLDLSSPWIATADYKSIYRFPADAFSGNAPTTKQDTGAAGHWIETITPGADSLTIRYDFDLADDARMAHLEWVWRLEPTSWNGTLAEATAGSANTSAGVQPVEGLHVSGRRQMDFMLPYADLSVSCRCGDGVWSFADNRSASWARCYRFQYQRDISPSAGRKGWFEVTIRAKASPSPLFALTNGEAVTANRIPFQVGPLPGGAINKAAGTLLLLHTAGKSMPRGAVAGDVDVVFADGERAKIVFREGAELTSSTDDPRSVVNGQLASMSDKSPAWVTVWHNPKPAVAIQRIESHSTAGDWRLLAVSATEASADPRRVMIATRGEVAPLAEESTIPLDGTWRFSADGVKDRDITVPSFWDRKEGLGNVHEAAYRRTFEVPSSFIGRRVSLHFDAVGDAAEVWVNGRMAGMRISPALPFDVDITGLVHVPSTDNQLEVRVKDDSHFGIPRTGESSWRALRTWIPRGMGANNRKGLYQSASLRALPAVRIANVRIQTSVRQHELTVVYTLQNTTQDVVRAQLSATVRPAKDETSTVVMVPSTDVELGGFDTKEVTLRAPFNDVELWQPDHPALYMLRSILAGGEGRLERVDTRFGFREVWFEGASFYLNGIRCNLRGESPSYGEKIEMFATREAATEMLKRYQKVNFNVVRFHSMPAPPHVLDLCDEMGMMVIDESGIYASWGMLMPEHADWLGNCRDHLVRWVTRDRNHPAVILWSAENEGLNVSGLSPALLAEYRRIIDATDSSRPVVFDGDGTGMGASPASVKHYVSTISDLENRGGVASGYGHDLRNDIYWATALKQDFPLGCGEFLFPYEPGIREHELEVEYMMGLQTRGYRLANWYDIRPYNPSYCGFLRKEGVRPGFEGPYDIIVKSFAPVAVFDKAYDELGPFPKPPVLKVGEPAERTLIIYNDEFADEHVELEWSALQGGKKLAGERLAEKIPLGDHIQTTIRFVPSEPGPIRLELIARKAGAQKYVDARMFEVR